MKERKRGLRVVYCDWNAPYADLLRRAKLTTLLNKRLQSIATLMYKIKHDLAPQTVQSIFHLLTHSYYLRNSDFSSHKLTQYIMERTLSKWSKLDHQLRSLPSVASFSRATSKANVEDILNNCLRIVFYAMYT